MCQRLGTIPAAFAEGFSSRNFNKEVCTEYFDRNHLVRFLALQPRMAVFDGRTNGISFEFKGMKDLTLGYRKIRWPTMQDKLFECDRDWWPNTNLDLGGKGWLAYLTGYKKAADALAKQFLRNWQGNDNLICPKVFLYRQSLEPQLKLTIIIAYRLLDEQTPSKDEMFQDHSLQKLWARCRPAFERIAEKGFWPRHRKGAFEAVEKLILEFHNIDPSAEYFRYAFQKPKRGGKPTLPKLSPVGIENLRRGMRHLHSFFNAHIDGIDVYLGAGKDY